MNRALIALTFSVLSIWAPVAMATPEEDMAALAKRYETQANAQRQQGYAQSVAEQSQANQMLQKCNRYQSQVRGIDKIMHAGYSARTGEALREQRRTLVKEMEKTCG